MSLMEDLQLASQVIQQADALVIAAGAGMGVDSGLPDFRGREGFWQAYPALAKAKLDFTQVASPHTFEVDPALAWGFYGHRLDLYRRTIPHQGFEILRQWGEGKALGYWVFTSNVDGQFQKAGFSKELINECHGSIHHFQCINDCHGHIWSADGFFPEVNEEHCLLRNALPHCPSCSKLARPNILMFGDGDWNPSRQLMQQRNQDTWLESMVASQAKIAVIEIGAGTSVPSVRYYTQQLGRYYGARLIRINVRESTVVNRQDVAIPMGAKQALLQINDLF